MSLRAGLRSRGRGQGYSRVRGALESTLRVLYRGDWPARLWAHVPGSCDVVCSRSMVPLLPAGARPVRVGFASDLHLGPTTPARLLDAAFGYLEGAELDVLLLGGDYVFLEATAAKARELAARVAAVPARRKLAVLGNHDLWTSHGTLEAALRGVGVEVLVNESVALGGGVQVVGLDDPWTGRRDTAQAFTGMGDAHAVVVLCHSPDSLWDAKSAVPEGVAAFYVCGHTHGGHLATPWGPLVVPGPVGKRYPRGEHQIGSLRLCVSRGVGGIELPIRTYARPEVHVFELVTSSSVRGAAPTSAADPGGAEP